MFVPTLPELFVMGFYATNPDLEWGLTLLAVVIVAEFCGNGMLFLLVRRFGLPHFLKKPMKKWMGFLMVKDERVILVNRVAPVLPFVGAFIATMKWDVKKSFIYIFVGGAVKYAVLITFVGIFFAAFEAEVARNATISAILAIIIVSFVQSYFASRKLLGPVAKRVAHLHEESSVVPPPAPTKDEEHGGDAGGANEKQ
jgi:membrane protein DedA with SNARE-associated domain